MCVCLRRVCVDLWLCVWTYLQRHAARGKDGEEEAASHDARPIIIIIYQQNARRLQLKKAHSYTYPKSALVWAPLQEHCAQARKRFAHQGVPFRARIRLHYMQRKHKQENRAVYSFHSSERSCFPIVLFTLHRYSGEDMLHTPATRFP